MLARFQRISKVKAILVLSGIVLAASAFKFKPEVIYGIDDRQDYYQIQDLTWLDAVNSTAVMMDPERLRPALGGQTFELVGETFQSRMDLCTDERFAQQPSYGSCSAFLIADDIVATAGHCVQATDCSDQRFVFDFNVKSEGEKPTSVPATSVYGCSEVLKMVKTNAADYAIVKLDRKVEGRKILPMSSQQPAVGAKLTMIGYPSGLPVKFEAGGRVRRVASEFFVATTDSYGGNSGSAVFNSETHEVEGILVRGEVDFKYDSSADGCYRSKVCTEDECRGEDVTNISFVKDFLNQ